MSFRNEWQFGYTLTAILLSSLALILPCHAASFKTIKATVYQLSKKPEKFDGHLVRVEARLVTGWEMGDSFMSDPNPRELRDGRPAYVWLHCSAEREKIFYEKIGGSGNIYGWFTGYFHFVAEPHNVYGVFYPGHLQFEVVDVSVPKDQPSTLAEAIRGGTFDEVRKFLRTGANLNVRDEYQSFPLFEAVNSDHTEIALELLRSGANPRLKEPDGSTFLMTAAWLNNVEVAKVLLERGVPVNSSDTHGNTALIFASQTCPDGKMVQILLDAGADRKSEALIAAAGNPIVAEKLIKAGADPTLKDSLGHTIEDRACDRGEKGHYQVCLLVRQALGKK